MLKPLSLLFISLFLLSGCVDGFKGYFKKSANNKLIDTKGFHGRKRPPLYNSKYINRAQQNLIEENYDEEEEEFEDELYIKPTSSQLNRQMYIDMINNKDKKLRNRQKFDSYRNNYVTADIEDYHPREYPSLAKASKQTSKFSSKDEKIQNELSEIRSLLNETKKDLAKYKCPLQPDTNKSKEIIVPNKPVKINPNKI